MIVRRACLIHGGSVFGVWGLGFTEFSLPETPKICNMMVIWAIFRGLVVIILLALGGLGSAK